jgi:hypothetical protein
MTVINSTQALSLLGKSFDFIITCPGEYGPDFDNVHARVLAVQVPAPGTDIEWSILLLIDGFKDPDYFELDRLHFQ